MCPRFPVRILTLVVVICVALGAPAVDAEVVEGATFGSWQAECETDPKVNRTGCFIVQNLVLREGGQRVLQLAVGFVESAPEPIALLSLPLGISLPPGTHIDIDGREAARIAVERCEPNGCRAGIRLTEDLVRLFREGREVTVTFFDAKREPIVVPLSLDGFAAGLDALAAERP